MLIESNRTGAGIIADILVQFGIKGVYLYSGGTIAPLLDAIIKRKITYYCARHEQGAGYAALAHARLTRTTQVILVSSGPGVTNIITSVADAFFDSTPAIIITGQVATTDMKKTNEIRQRGFQEIDTVSLMTPIAKKVFLAATASELRGIFEEAFYLTTAGRFGPVVIDLPMNVQKEIIREDISSFLPPKKEIINRDDSLLFTLIKWLQQAKRPVLLVGQGALASDATEWVRKIAETYSIPVVMSLLGLSAFPSTHTLSMSFLGHTGTRYANLAIHHADLVIVVGARLDVRQTGTRTDEFVPLGKIVRIEIDDAEIIHSRVRCDMHIQGDCKDTLINLYAHLKKHSIPSYEKWITICQKWKQQFTLSTVYETNQLYPQAIIETLNKLTENKNCIVVTGVGLHQQWVARHFNFDYPRRRWLTSGGHGAMGYDIPSAIGAKLAYPNAMVLCIVGDGSFQINMQELGAIAEYNIPIKIIVLDNQRLGIVSQFQKFNWNNDPSTGNKLNPRFDIIASAYKNILAYSLSSPIGMASVLEEFLRTDTPALIHCHVKTDEDIQPMLMANQTMNNMWPLVSEYSP